MLATSETACLRILTSTVLLDRVVTTSDLHDSVGKTDAQCFVGSFSVMIAAGVLMLDDVREV